MKKILTLVLALALILTAVSAFASSPEEPNQGGNAVPNNGGAVVAVKAPEITVKFITDTEASAAVLKLFADAAAAGDVLAPLPDDIKAKIPEGFNKINELLTAQFEGDLSLVKDEMILNVMFQTPYGDGQDVMVLIGILPEKADGEVEWNVYKGVGKADGSVDVTVPKEIFEKVQTNPFLIGVISDK